MSRILSPCVLATLASCLLLLTGCATDRHKAADPLLGAPPPAALGKPAPVASAPASNPAPANPTTATVPPATTTAPATMAALAANSSRLPADPRSDLRIGDAASRPPMAQLRPPESAAARTGTLTSTVQPGNGTLPPAPGGQPPGSNASLEQAQARLAGRGVRWQRLEMAPDQRNWQFSCSIPSRQNPNISRTYEAQGATPANAVQAVLDQLDRDQF